MSADFIAWLATINGRAMMETPAGRDEIAHRAAALSQKEAAPSEAEDAERLDWLVNKLFVSSWNGVVGSGARTDWRIAPDYRHTMQKLSGESLREAIDIARATQGDAKIAPPQAPEGGGL